MNWRDYWSKMLGTRQASPPPVSRGEILWSGLGGFVGMAVIAWVETLWLADQDLHLMIGSFGASAVLVFGAIRSPLAQPRNLIGGHFLSALVGVVAYQLAQPLPWLAASLAVAGAMAVSEAGIYGGQTIMGSAGFFESTQAALTQGKSLQAVVEDYLHVNRGIPGYGRPIRRMDADERIAPILKLADSLGLGGGRHVALAQRVESILASGHWRMRMNYGAITAALTLDLGFTSQDHYLFTLPAFLAGMPPCYVDALARPEGATFPIACNQIDYCGPKGKSWQDT